MSNSFAPVNIGGFVIQPTPHRVKIAIRTKMIPNFSPTIKYANMVVTIGELNTITVMSPTDKYCNESARSTTDVV
jgi:hypothetical protein